MRASAISSPCAAIRPRPGTNFEPHPDGYRDAAELVAGLKKVAPFEISVAAYPECHPDSSTRSADLDNLKRKIDAGADRAITQFFFSRRLLLPLPRRCRGGGDRRGDRAGHPAGLERRHRPGTFAATCGAAIPHWMDDLFEGLDDLPAARQLVAATVAAELCGQLYAGGVRHFHFYTLEPRRARLRDLPPARPAGPKDA